MLPVKDPVRLLAPGSSASPELRESLQSLRTALPGPGQLDSLATRLTLAGAPVSYEGSGIVPKVRLPGTQAAALKAAAAAGAAASGVVLALYLASPGAPPHEPHATTAASAITHLGVTPEPTASTVSEQRGLGGDARRSPPGGDRHEAASNDGTPTPQVQGEDRVGGSSQGSSGAEEPPSAGAVRGANEHEPNAVSGPGAVGSPLGAAQGSPGATLVAREAAARRSGELVSQSDEQVTEPELLRRARAALSSAPGKTLELAEVHRRRFAGGVMVQEREFLAITALARLGRTSAAEARGRAFRHAFPGSPYERQLRGLLPGVFSEP